MPHEDAKSLAFYVSTVAVPLENRVTDIVSPDFA